MKKLDKQLLNKLADNRLKIEKGLAIEERVLGILNGRWQLKKREIDRLKLERSRLSMDIRLICSEKEPRFSSEFRGKNKATVKK